MRGVQRRWPARGRARIGHAGALRGCAALTAVSLLGCSVAPGLTLLLVPRGVGGAASAALFVVGASLAGLLGRAAGRSGAVLSTYYAGVGPGILLTAALADGVLSEPGRWRAGWLIFGVLAAGCGLLASRVASRVPTPTEVNGRPQPSVDRWRGRSPR